MKKTFLIAFLTSCSLAGYSQSEQANQTTNAIYRLYPTQNIWTFIKLNTRNGQMWQVQFDVKEDNRFETFLNLLPLVSAENESNDRFALYPTQNIYNFILIDQLSGKVWQVQWSTEILNRAVFPIN